MTQERVAVIGGTGALGAGIALRLAASGVPVVVGSRDAMRAAETAAQVTAQVPGSSVDGAANADAVAAATIAILTVPFASHAATVKQVAPALACGTVLVDATVPLATAIGGRPTQTLGVWHGSAAEQARALVPAGVPVVAALHTVSAAVLADLSLPLDEDTLICGDDRAAKHRVAQLIGGIAGLRPVDAGPLDRARIVEQLTPLLIGLNIRYKTHSGIAIRGLPATLWREVPVAA